MNGIDREAFIGTKAKDYYKDFLKYQDENYDLEPINKKPAYAIRNRS